MVDLKEVDAIIFDFGGVILEIDPRRTIAALQKYSKLNLKLIYSDHNEIEFIDHYEEGKINCDDFRELIRSKLKVVASDEQIDEAWSALLVDTTKKRIDLLEKLKSSYRTYLYSNTCHIHKVFFDQHLLESYGVKLDSLFDSTYYSHMLGIRKPKEEGFVKIVEREKLDLRRTLFIDDNVNNIKAAKCLGFKTFLIDPKDCITRHFS